MQRLTMAVAMTAMLSGCQTYRGSKQTAITGGLMTVGGAALLAGSLALCDPGCGANEPSGVMLIVSPSILALGITAAVGGLIGMAAYR